MAQLTRHRVGSFTSASQHYADYSDMPFVVSEAMAQDKWACEHLKIVKDAYDSLQRSGMPKEEARQILPNAMAVNLIWTVNARSLLNFFRQRLCRRNVEEMHIFADKVLAKVIDWWPDFGELMGPPCATDGKCNQGFLSCGKPQPKINPSYKQNI